LEEDRSLRALVEATLSQMFGRRVLFEWDSGILEPRVLEKTRTTTYSLHREECHGLKELVVLLTHLHDPQRPILIVDEPELNLHPQYQSYILETFRAYAMVSGKQILLITHSPYMLDIRTPDDLQFLYCFNGAGQVPRRVSDLRDIDASKARRCISQMNAHHRQLFFADTVVLVEGVGDRLILTALLERSGKSISAAGATLIDVTGKDDIPFFLRFAEALGKSVVVLSDLDALFDGSVRRVLAKDAELQSALGDLGGGIDIQAYIGQIQRDLRELHGELVKVPNEQRTALGRVALACTIDQVLTEPSAHRYLAKLVLNHAVEEWAEPLRPTVTAVKGRLDAILRVFWEALRVRFLGRGQLEDYLVDDYENIFSYSDKRKQELQANTLAVLYDNSGPGPESRAGLRALLALLEVIPQRTTVDYWTPLIELGRELVQYLQLGAASGDVRTLEAAREVVGVRFKNLERVAQLVEFNWEAKDKCAGRISFTFQGTTRELTFDQDTPVHQIKL